MDKKIVLSFDALFVCAWLDFFFVWILFHICHNEHQNQEFEFLKSVSYFAIGNENNSKNEILLVAFSCTVELGDKELFAHHQIVP